MIRRQFNHSPKGGELWNNIAYWRGDTVNTYIIVFTTMQTTYHTAGKYTKIYSRVLSEIEVIWLLESNIQYNDLYQKNIYDIGFWLEWNRDKMNSEKVKPLKFNRDQVCRPKFFSPRFDLPSQDPGKQQRRLSCEL